ncbi:TGF-beta-activated kinase 1 and MAP3K7-binding protein 1-like [Nilaparvata lugens]|uniref:TGF-beta-activated kinase 1 and MAP3K7-binding protein 1-like n=1 Tax=Nilaparvata lugens TaxID=108931 RepID=UPI00193D56F6|nr:TGF-beta-activated kinase 1 and MAP3K7-binding protein 1-like [Nilaparvata lugens]
MKMPTRAEPRLTHSGYESSISWTDDLPVCKQSGVGYSTNQVYREDGHRREDHPFEDASIHCRLNDTCLYGVFDGHNGAQTAAFALQSLASEILFDPKLQTKTTDDEVREFLRQAFVAVERSYLKSFDDKLAERTSLSYEIPDGLKVYEAYQKYPEIVNKLNAINNELSCGTTAVIALVLNQQLFVANVGDSRALLCKTDSNGVLRVIQLSVDHDLSNEDELLRLYNLGLPFEKVAHGYRLGNQENTRCLGNYLVKGAYKEFEELAQASSEPITAEPEIHGGILLDESCRFLLLMSDGLYRSLEATGIEHDQVNKEIAQMVTTEFRVQTTLMGVAQAVVDRVVRRHHDMFMSGEAGAGAVGGQGIRDDITLLVRNFNFPLPNAHTHAPNVPPTPTTNVPWFVDQASRVVSGQAEDDGAKRQPSDTNTSTATSTTTTSTVPPTNQPQLIKPYVDFSEFFRNVEKAKLEGCLPEDIEF